ncbi:MAG: glycosyltransferase family 39 protein [Anaerolineales bacterium]
MSEPSVLDYVKAFLARQRLPAIPALPKGRARAVRTAAPRRAVPRQRLSIGTIPWLSISAFILFLNGQFIWARPNGSTAIWLLGGFFALLALIATVWAAVRHEWRLPKLEDAAVDKRILTFRRIPLALGLLFFGLTLLFSGGNQFNFVNTTLWFLSVVFTLAAFWQTRETLSSLWAGFSERIGKTQWSIAVSRWSLLLLGALLLIAAFRFSGLVSMPLEMTSDHAEKLLDVSDIVAGQTSIFFERNSGREPFQFYWTAWVGQIFGMGVSFLSLKLGTTLLAFVSLIYVYLLGKELGGRWVGLFALLLVGLAYWANVLARTGLRFSLYPTFAAPTLYYLLIGLRRGALNYFLLSGLFLGISLLGYTASRVMPVVVVAAVIIFLLHKSTPELRRRAIIGLALLALVSLVVFAPLMRYAIDRPDLFGFRTFTRVFQDERAYPAPVWQIFPTNVARALAMFNYSGGDIWLVGLVREPAFDWISASLFLLGLPLLILRYARTRQWQDLFLLISLPLLMLPSTLSLAFPEENPAMNRASGAWIAGFLIGAIALDTVLHTLREKLNGRLGLWVAGVVGTIVLLISAALNYGLFFGRYIPAYDLYSWNTSELGGVIADYADSFGSLDSAWVVAYPHWVDTRLVGMNAGNPTRDYAIWPDQLSSTLEIPAPKLFLLKPEDGVGLDALRQLYPAGLLNMFQSRVPTKEFMVFFVPAQ